jgi:DNA-binding NtrC family response regulator
VAVLTEHLLERHQLERPLTFSPSALDALAAYDWPGNVRQLERVLERTVALAPGPVIDAHDLPEEISTPFQTTLTAAPEENESLRTWSSRYVRLVLERCNGNKRRACDLLEISFHTLNAHLKYRSSARGAGSRGVAAPVREDIGREVTAAAGCRQPGLRQ